jgi:ABC-2 type transport system ATP-binding protein
MTVSEPAIQAEGLTKLYGRHPGIIDLTLDVDRGQIFGFLGPNGAGKTTTIRLLIDLIRPTRGRARVLGLDPRADGPAVRRHVGYLPGELALYENNTGRELLTFCASMRGIDDQRRGMEITDRLGIELSRRIADLSKGNKQKVGILLAMFHHPELLIMDEPTSGLDPIAQREVHGLLDDARAEGRTVFLSSHVLSEVEHIADSVGIIREGSIVAVESIQDLKRRALRQVEIRYTQPIPARAFAGVPGIRSADTDGSLVRLSVEGAMDPALRAVMRWPIEHPHLHGRAHLMRAPGWAVGAIDQAREALGLVPPEPSMHRLARHVIPTRDLDDRDTIADHREYCLIPLLHDTQLHQHVGECRGSGGASVNHQPEPRNPSAGADMSRVRRNQTPGRWAPGDSNPEPAD